MTPPPTIATDGIFTGPELITTAKARLLSLIAMTLFEENQSIRFVGFRNIEYLRNLLVRVSPVATMMKARDCWLINFVCSEQKKNA